VESVFAVGGISSRKILWKFRRFSPASATVRQEDAFVLADRLFFVVRTVGRGLALQHDKASQTRTWDPTSTINAQVGTLLGLSGCRDRWFADSLLEGAGFELSVPREISFVSVLVDFRVN
jgi:hypothetical protein